MIKFNYFLPELKILHLLAQIISRVQMRCAGIAVKLLGSDKIRNGVCLMIQTHDI